MSDTTFMKMNADRYIRMALEEDITSEDISTNCVMPEYQKGQVDLICKQDGVICGLWVFQRVFELLDDTVTFDMKVKEGDFVHAGDLMAVVPAVIGKLNQSTDIYIMPVNRLRHSSRLLCGIISERIVLIRRKERDPFLTLQSLLIFQLINQIKHIGNLHCPFTLLPIPTSSQVVCRTFLQYPDPRSSPAAMSPVPF